MKIFYSSGSLTSNTFEKNTSKSIGGLHTNVQILNGLKNLFGFISLRDVQYSNIEYRCFYLYNDGKSELQNVKLYIAQPYIITTEINPANLTPAANDKYLVPINSIGLWHQKDGYLATWTGTAWTYEMPYLFDLQFGVDDNSEVQILNSPFDMPFNVEFNSCNSNDDGTTNFLNIGNINAGEYKAIWVKKTVFERSIVKTDFDIETAKINKPLTKEQNYNMTVSADVMDLLTINYSGDLIFDAQTLQTLSFNIIRTENDLNYENLGFEFLCNFNGASDFNNITGDAIFETQTYSDIQLTNQFADFNSADITSDTLQLNITFTDVGIFDLTVNVIDLSNNSNIVSSKLIRVTVN